VPRLLFFALHVKSGQAVFAALHENYAKKFGEEDALIILARCLKNWRKQGNSHAMKSVRKGQYGAGK
jgi:hypothetical protein